MMFVNEVGLYGIRVRGWEIFEVPTNLRLW